jgi:branched-subunit amino acid transport protein
MSQAWLTVAILGIGTFALKAAGPLLVGGRRLPPVVERLADLAPAALLAALVATSVVTDGTTLVVDARLVGLGVASLALWRRLPFLAVVTAAALATALTRTVAG